MRTVLNTTFSAVPERPLQSSSIELPEGTRAVWVCVESDVGGRLHFEMWNTDQSRWVTFDSQGTVGGDSEAGVDDAGQTPTRGWIYVHDVAGLVEHRFRWMPSEAQADSFVTITTGVSG